MCHYEWLMLIASIIKRYLSLAEDLSYDQNISEYIDSFQYNILYNYTLAILLEL